MAKASDIPAERIRETLRQIIDAASDRNDMTTIWSEALLSKDQLRELYAANVLVDQYATTLEVRGVEKSKVQRIFDVKKFLTAITKLAAGDADPVSVEFDQENIAQLVIAENIVDQRCISLLAEQIKNDSRKTGAAQKRAAK